ncbi:DUF1168-domain-containing protein [Emericellopsis cladophorae]|uniref:DUF1168-domain-containing protein n=1 Tax=Emericellopsis cladophorae TaxID=2686198 RepID=A0A9Q0BGV4_9HYPO|nr:DUF1168-domain-containing protein [Emericellopsis cladophorae]KAI6785402.1 DUF1168-domain-containing protein [Emericellopsis cladophorae]
MSAGTQDSVPTSADPKSHRPTKRRALLSPTAQQASSLDALFAKPPPPPTSTSLTHSSGVSAPPEIVNNVQGSSAGAGSGEFHVYKALRRREYERTKAMDEEVRREKENEQFEKEKAEREKRDEEKTKRNREKREKAKARKGKKGKGGTGGGGADQAPQDAKSNDANGAKIVPRKLEARNGETDGKESGDGSKEGEEGEEGAETTQPDEGLVIHDDD